ncbi:MAG TPA: hypothetical protein VFZ43_02965 [Anaerolineales bacterium]
MGSDDDEIGVGATEELSLRVSVATLVSVLFAHPENGKAMLALERTATLREIKGPSQVIVRANPFGGAVRLADPQALEERIGHFHYDSIRSRQERDFRIQIDPASWEKVKQVCRQHLKETGNGILDSSPERELAEEFEDSLNVKMAPGQYRLQSRGIIIEDMPVETDNVRAEGFPTVRVYYVFEAWIEAPQMIRMVLANHSRYSDKDLEQMAWEDAVHGGKGRANAVLALGLDDLNELGQSMMTSAHNEPIWLRGHQLDRSVLAILPELPPP